MNNTKSTPPNLIKAIFPLSKNTATDVARADFDNIAAKYNLFAYPEHDYFIVEGTPQTVNKAMRIFVDGARAPA